MTQTSGSRPRTLFDKIWESHLVRAGTSETPALLYIDLHLIHEVTSPQAFAVLAQRGLSVRRPDRTVAMADHSIPTTPRDPGGRVRFSDSEAAAQVAKLEENCQTFGIELYGPESLQQGIVHVVGPEQGYTWPGMTVVCGDSHTSTHGAFGALAFGIGTTEVSHVLATQCLLQRRPKTMAIRVRGQLGPSVTAKDLILAIISKIGVGGGTEHVIEYIGGAVQALSMEERMTICNMSIEAGARAGLIAPDEVTFAWLKGRPRAPGDADWPRMLEHWQQLTSDFAAQYDREVEIDASQIAPMITWGTNPGSGIPIDGRVPEGGGHATHERSLQYMGLRAGQPLIGQPIDVVFLGSCTNSRLSDLRSAAKVIKGRQIADGVRMLVVPGSRQVQRAAESEGLDRIFREAGAEWREPGCSMCIAMNGDQLRPGQYAVSTSNRNFEGRQGAGGRTFLASPLTAAAAAVTGRLTDVRELCRPE